MKKQHKKTKQFSIKRFIVLYLIYTFLFLTISFFLDMYDLFIYNPYLLTIGSFILGAVIAYYHIKNGEKTRVDDIIDKL
ncbi:MAG TPA: hypothetical protein ENK67_01285 [Flavobacteriia bacterium]|nr:hypothetical protein [Flavobacteriia bacterium]